MIWQRRNMPSVLICLCMQDQASIPRPMEVEAVEKPRVSSAYGQGSGILGALTSTSLTGKPAGSNMQRLGSKMVIPSAIDSSGLVDVASISREPARQAASSSGLQLTAMPFCTHAAHGLPLKRTKLGSYQSCLCCQSGSDCHL